MLPLLVLAAASVASADSAAVIEKLRTDTAVAAALAAVERNEPALIEEQIRLCEIPAPPFEEAERGKAVAEAFRKIGVRDVRIDAVGNVIGRRPGAGPKPNVVLSAHLDTVFPPGTDVKVKREGTLLRGPGIGDDCRGLAVILGVARALNDASVSTPGEITFVATVGEEGLGDLRGVKHLFHDSLKGRIDAFLSVDGTGLSITNAGVGSYRYRVTYKGPGGHSWGAFGNSNPIHALGRAIARVADFETPANPKTTFNVGRIGGGTSVNSIAFEAWMEVDMRSGDAASLEKVHSQFKAAVAEAETAENRRWNDKAKIRVSAELVGLRPAGSTPESSVIVQHALTVTRLVAGEARLREGSTDSNVPMHLGIPAVTISGGGTGTGAHSLDEAFDTAGSSKGTVRALLLTLALAR